MLLLSYLKHLDEGDTEVQVGQVAANQAQRKHDTNRHNGPQVHSPRHRYLLPRVEHGGEARHELCHDRREEQMPCREEDWVVELGRVEDPFVEEDDGGGERDPCSVHNVSALICTAPSIDGSATHAM